MRKQFLAMLLTTCMALSMMPTAAFAQENPTTGITNTNTLRLHTRASMAAVEDEAVEDEAVKSQNDSTGMFYAVTNESSITFTVYQIDLPKFADIENHWAKNDIDFVFIRGLISSTDEKNFSPEATITKAEFAKALSIIAGKDVSSVIKGDKNKEMTRQEMAEMMLRFAKTTNYKLLKNRKKINFTDTSSEAVKTMQMAGVVVGKKNNKFDPDGKATKAEASAVLRRYIEMIIDVSTTQGFDFNDSGKIVYYEKGKLCTDKKNIDGTTYYFNKDGICTKIDS